MPRTFFAICRDGVNTVIRRIPLKVGVQIELEAVFDAQEEAFLMGRDEDVVFDGGWKPDNNELLVIEDEDLAAPFAQTLSVGPAAYDQLDVTNYAQAGIKGIFTRSGQVEDRILLQRFQTSQYLQRSGLTLVFSNNQFGKLSENGFSLDTRLTAVIDGNQFKFVSFRNLRTILTIQQHFEQATEAEIASFKGHPTFFIEDLLLFDASMDERSRMLIRGIGNSGVLNDHNAASIAEKAGSIGLQIDLEDGRLVLPANKKRLKTILSFLEESVYKGVFTNGMFETNSKRRVQ